MSNNVVTAEGLANIEPESLLVDRQTVWRGTLQTGPQNTHLVFFSGGAANIISKTAEQFGALFWVRIQGKLVSFNKETYVIATYALPATTMSVDAYRGMLHSGEYHELASILADGYIRKSLDQSSAGLFGDHVTVATLLTDKDYAGGAHMVVLKGTVRRLFSEWIGLRREGFHALVQGKLVTSVDQCTRIFAASLRPSGSFSTHEFR